MDLRTASLFGSYISKEYSEDIFSLLMTYSDISASEAASRLKLHIKTVQSFLEAMAEVGILNRKQVTEKKRPYYRYSLIDRVINISIDLDSIKKNENDSFDSASIIIREKTDSGARFNTARYDSYFSSVVIWHGDSRNRTERKLNLTRAQGQFLYNLPFPGARALTINQLLDKSGLDKTHISEIIDIVNVLIKHNVIENVQNN